MADTNLHEYFRSALKIGVFGSDGEHCALDAERISYDVGRLLAEQGAIVFTGGGHGVMAATCRGVCDVGGISIGISPYDNPQKSNGHSSLIIPTGIGYARCQILVNSVEGAIVVAGGVGTLQEIGSMYLHRKPVVTITSSGGVAARYAGIVLDERNLDAILGAESANEAVRLVIEKVNEKRCQMGK